METHADEAKQAVQSTAPANGAAQHSNVARPLTDEERLESLRYEEILANINRDYTMSVVPPNFILHESAAEHQERLRQTRAGLAALREGDPDEHRETLEAVLRSLDDDASWKGERSSE
jgi:hypothetical protein